jgi:hypothetical protein
MAASLISDHARTLVLSYMAERAGGARRPPAEAPQLRAARCELRAGSWELRAASIPPTQPPPIHAGHGTSPPTAVYAMSSAVAYPQATACSTLSAPAPRLSVHRVPKRHLHRAVLPHSYPTGSPHASCRTQGDTLTRTVAPCNPRTPIRTAAGTALWPSLRAK